MKRTALALALGLTALLGGRDLRAEDAAAYAVVVHPSNSLESLSRSQASDLFLGRTTTWKGKGPVVAITGGESSAATKLFLWKVVRKTWSQFGLHWKKKMLSGDGKTPQELADNAARIALVEKTAGAVAIVESVPEGAAVKTLKIRE